MKKYTTDYMWVTLVQAALWLRIPLLYNVSLFTSKAIKTIHCCMPCDIDMNRCYAFLVNTVFDVSIK